MKIVVYFENGRASSVEAQFASEELYAEEVTDEEDPIHPSFDPVFKNET